MHQPWSGRGALTVKPPRTRPALHTRHPLQTGATLRSTEVSSPRSSALTAGPPSTARRAWHDVAHRTTWRAVPFGCPSVSRSPWGRVARQWFPAGSGVWAGRRAVRGPAASCRHRRSSAFLDAGDQIGARCQDQELRGLLRHGDRPHDGTLVHPSRTCSSGQARQALARVTRWAGRISGVGSCPLMSATSMRAISRPRAAMG